MKHSIIFFSLCTTILLLSSFQSNNISSVPFLNSDQEWADSILSQMSVDEKLGQLFMVAAYSNKNEAHYQFIDELINKYHIGGLIFFQGGPIRQANLTNRYQKLSKIPLLIGIDGEWGLSMRLDSTTIFPRQLMLGAIQDNKLIYEMGKEIGYQCKRLGIHINFAPVVDINVNPNNPVINDRSFGEDKTNVSNKGLAYMKGLQDAGIIACAKHFPGHGDTDKDSHKTLPIISHDKKRLNELEMAPFKALINKGVGSIMVAHLNIPALEKEKDLAVSLSQNVVTNILKQKMGFKGLVITDALNMKGVSSYFAPGEVDLKALLAGNDILLFPENIPAAIEQIKKAITKGLITQGDIDKRIKKILLAKHWCGLHQDKFVETTNLHSDLNNPNAELLNIKLRSAALTLLNNDDKTVPIKNLDKIKIASISIGQRKQNSNTFQNTLSKYAVVKHFNVKNNISTENAKFIVNQIQKYEVVIVSLHNMSRHPSRNFGITSNEVNFINELKKKTNLILVVFGNPYGLKNFDRMTILQAYDESHLTQALAAQLLFGGIKAKGKLPVTASKNYKYNDGIIASNTIRLRYSIPEDAGINRADLLKMDTIVWEAINNKSIPGCQILIAKDNKVIFEKAYGYHTYAEKNLVEITDLYDLASITKIAATTLSLMKLYEQKKLNLNKSITQYLDGLKKTNKKKLLVKDLLLHQAGLLSWIPFYASTLTKEGLCDSNYCYSPDAYYEIEVADHLYIQKHYPDSIWKYIVESDLRRRRNYLYSDLGFYFGKKIAENLSKMDINKHTSTSFYKPLGLSTLGYLPRENHSLKRIVPTEWDSIFRKQLVHGHVHDPGAAMLGGVAGHAGLFSNANDLGILMQMLLNKGTYGGKKYFEAATVDLFTSKQTKNNRRGLGFDKPEPDYENGPTSSYASNATFGHSGFTGTCVWADPKYDLVYIFLSNRVHPSANNRKLISTNVRTRIQDVIYEAIGLKKKVSTKTTLK